MKLGLEGIEIDQQGSGIIDFVKNVFISKRHKQYKTEKS